MIEGDLALPIMRFKMYDYTFVGKRVLILWDVSVGSWIVDEVCSTLAMSRLVRFC